MKIIISSTLLLLLFSCKTREDIARERLVSNLAHQMKDGQKLQTGFTSRIEGLEDQLNKIRGKMEEGDHQVKTTLEDKIKNIESKILELQAQGEVYEQELDDIKTKLKKIKKSKQGANLYNQALKNYKAGKYKTARKQFLSLMKDKSLKGKQKTRIMHNLGMIAYINKNNNKALTYFGRLFTSYPRSSYNKNGLLITAKSFIRQKKKEEARQTLNELIKRFPKAKQVKEARKLLKTL